METKKIPSVIYIIRNLWKYAVRMMTCFRPHMAKHDINTSCQFLRDVIAACSAGWHKWTRTLLSPREGRRAVWEEVICPLCHSKHPGTLFFFSPNAAIKKPPNSDYISKLQRKGSACENRELGAHFERIDVRWCFTSSWIAVPADVHSAARPDTPDGTFHTSADDTKQCDQEPIDNAGPFPKQKLGRRSDEHFLVQPGWLAPPSPQNRLTGLLISRQAVNESDGMVVKVRFQT